MWLSAKLLRDPNLSKAITECLLNAHAAAAVWILQNLYFKAKASDMSKNADLQLANCIKAQASFSLFF